MSRKISFILLQTIKDDDKPGRIHTHTTTVVNGTNSRALLSIRFDSSCYLLIFPMVMTVGHWQLIVSLSKKAEFSRKRKISSSLYR